MGAIKFPHASGNSMSIASPATNPASDLEIKLPATIGTANQYLKNSGTAGTLEFATLSVTSPKILNQVYASTTTEVSVTSMTATDIGLSVNITPSATNSIIHILILYNYIHKISQPILKKIFFSQRNYR